MKKKISLSAVFALSISAIVYAQKIDFTVRFPKGGDVMLPSCAEELKTWAISNFHYRNDLVELRGHTDSDADTDYNQKLSERRNEAVKSVLEENGFKQIRFVAYGENSPVCQSQNEECMQKNRRVEVVLYNEFSEQFLLDQNLPLPQTTFINHEKGDILRGAKGTEIYIPAKSFVRADGSAPQGVVRVELNEFYSKKECLEAKLTTSSDGKLLESGGMVFVEAFDDNSSLELSPDASLQIVFKTQAQGLKSGMQIFNGRVEGGKMNWVLPENPPKTKVITAQSGVPMTESASIRPLYNFWSYNVEVISGERESLLLFGLIKWEDMTAEEKGQFNDQQEKYLESLEKWKAEQKKRNYDLLLSTGALTWKELDEKEKKSFDNNQKTFDNLMKKNADKTRKLIKAREDSLVLVAQNREKERILRNAENLADFQKKTRDGQLQFTAKGALSARGLGWINCDSFYNYTSRTNFTVICQMTPADELHLVFKNMSAVMSGTKTQDGKVVFQNIPLGIEAYLVFTGDSKKGDESLFALEKITIGNEPFVLRPKSTSINDMHKMLEAIDQPL